ncbi:MAG: ArsR/SmtB family transcription factor [Candidatus Thorarchaeota archaeon]
MSEILGTNKEKDELDVLELLDFLSNTTRRSILELLAAEDLYPFQISRILDISPRIIKEYLKELEKMGIISFITRDSDKGPQRTYASLNKAFSLIIDVGQNTFDVKYFTTGNTLEEETKSIAQETEKMRKQTSQELVKIRNFLKSKVNEIRELDEKRKDYVQEVNVSFNLFNKIIEDVFSNYQDRQIIRSIFKILINKAENKVSLTELASRMRVWRGELGERIEYLAEETDFINIEVDRRGEVWYSI